MDVPRSRQQFCGHIGRGQRANGTRRGKDGPVVAPR